MNRDDRIVNIVLIATTLLMLGLCLSVISGPILFNNKRAEREKVVKERMMRIKEAETRFMEANGRYCGSLDSLVRGGWLADSLRYVPYSDKKEFTLTTTVKTTRTGRPMMQMECGAAYEDYLQGLDDTSLMLLLEDANVSGQYPGMRVNAYEVADDSID